MNDLKPDEVAITCDVKGGAKIGHLQPFACPLAAPWIVDELGKMRDEAWAAVHNNNPDAQDKLNRYNLCHQCFTNVDFSTVRKMRRRQGLHHEDRLERDSQGNLSDRDRPEFVKPWLKRNSETQQPGA